MHITLILYKHNPFNTIKVPNLNLIAHLNTPPLTQINCIKNKIGITTGTLSSAKARPRRRKKDGTARWTLTTLTTTLRSNNKFLWTSVNILWTVSKRCRKTGYPSKATGPINKLWAWFNSTNSSSSGAPMDNKVSLKTTVVKIDITKWNRINSNMASKRAATRCRAWTQGGSTKIRKRKSELI